MDEWSLPSTATTTTSQQQLAPTMFEAAAPRISSVSPILPYLSASPPPTDGGFVVPPMMTSSPPPPTTTATVNYNGRATAAAGRLEEEEFELPSDQFQLSDQVGKKIFWVPVSVGDPGPDPDPTLFS